MSALGRAEHKMLLERPLAELAGKRILVTGAAGSIGTALADVVDATLTDLDELDVTDPFQVRHVFDQVQPEVVLHLAGDKHAPAGEEDPWKVTQINALGTGHVLAAAGAARVVTASTCKACNPETAYGASKLIAERLTLNAGQAVARFYNVIETQGNVFDIWRQIDPADPIPWSSCSRYFITLREAIGLILWTAVLPPARYTVTPGEKRWMRDVAAATHPGRDLVPIPPRRGDRSSEPLHGDHELLVEHSDLASPTCLRRIVSPHDGRPAEAGRNVDLVRQL